MKKLLFFSDSIGLGGAELYFLKLIRAVRRQTTYDIRVVFPPREATRPLVDALGEDGIQVDLREVSRDTVSRTMDESDDCFRLAAPDLVHFVQPSMLSCLLPRRVALRMGIPFMATEQLVHKYYKLTEEQQREIFSLYGAAEHVIAVSAENKRVLVQQFHMPSEKIDVIHNAIDLNEFNRLCEKADPAALREELGLSGCDPIVVSVGRLHQQKGYSTLLEAIALLGAAFARAKFLLVGSGPMRDELHNQAVALGIDRSVLFTGMRLDVPSFLSLANLFVLPTRFEGLPFSILEALACGCPTVATNVSGIPEVIEDDIHGRLVPPEQPVALANAIGEALHSPRRELWRENGRRRVSAEFEFSGLVQKTLKLYDRILG